MPSVSGTLYNTGVHDMRTVFLFYFYRHGSVLFEEKVLFYL